MTTRSKLVKSNEVPRICLCGRPNVGKSSLFNRMLGRKKALVLDEPGVTRDVHRTQVEWDGHKLELADLAGLEAWGDRVRGATRKSKEADELQRLAAEAALEYLRGADLVLFVVDGRAGLTPADEELARLVRTTGREVQVVLSKIEGQTDKQALPEVAQLGWDEALLTSAEHNIGVEHLKECVLARLGLEGPARIGKAGLDDSETGAAEDSENAPFDEEEEDPKATEKRLEEEQKALERGSDPRKPVRLGVYGRPNVGKSTLVNRLLGEKRMITSPIAGTTVDTVDTDFEHEGRFFRILDTAGIRKKSKTEQGVEVLSVVSALKSLNEVDVSLFLIDGYEGVTDQDEKVAGELVKSGKATVIVVNKWDVCRVKEEDYAERLRQTLGFLDFAPIMFVSAEKGMGMDALWDLIDEIMRQRMFVAPTGELNRFFEMVEGTNNPTNVRLYYATQTSKNPPTITCLVSDPKKVHFAYERFLKNELRQRYGWVGSPLRLVFKARKRSESKKSKFPNRREPEKN